jgi:pyruvate dehydrogenase complex dehydrogenase (E1) component
MIGGNYKLSSESKWISFSKPSILPLDGWYDDDEIETAKEKYNIEFKKEQIEKENKERELREKIMKEREEKDRELKEAKEKETKYREYSRNKNNRDPKNNRFLQDKKKSSTEQQNTKIKTKMCKNILLNKTCTYRICNFAHSISELHPLECSFSNMCKYKKSTCQYIHEDESKSSYINRLQKL